MDKITGKPLEIIAHLMNAEDKNALYDLSLHKEVKKRSLNANNYFYALCTKIAEKQRISLNEVHNMMLSSYGYPEYMDDKIVYFILPDRVDVNKLDGVHLRATSKTQLLSNGELNRVYIVMRGSHTYNSAEMARLIDGVIHEAQQLEIETITPNQKAQMLQQWGETYARKNKSSGDNAEGQRSS